MSRLSPTERQKCAAVFKKLDVDRSGTVDLNEIHSAMRSMGMEADREVALEMIKEADADGDGELTLAEFENIYAKAAAEEGGYGAAVFSNLIGLEMGSLGLGGLPSPASLLADASAAASGAAQSSLRSMGITVAHADNSFDGSTLDSIGNNPLTASFREGEFELPEKGTGQLASAPLPEKGGNQFPEKGGNKSGKLPEKDAKKRASMLQSTTSGKKLTDQDVAKARAIFSRIDHDASGKLEFDEVKLALFELGADATDREVERLLRDFDVDGDGAINFQEFKTLYANAPAGFFTFDHVDQERLAQIEAHAQGRAGQHEQYQELQSFLRRMDKGVNITRVCSNGCARKHTTLYLTPGRNGFKFIYDHNKEASLPFCALRSVHAPFKSAADDKHGVLPTKCQAQANLTLVLTFAARPELNLATEMGRALLDEEKKKPSKSARSLVKKSSLLSMSKKNLYGGAETETSDAALLLAEKGMRQHPIHHEDLDDLYELNLDTKEQVSILKAALTGLESFDAHGMDHPEDIWAVGVLVVVLPCPVLRDLLIEGFALACRNHAQIMPSIAAATRSSSPSGPASLRSPRNGASAMADASVATSVKMSKHSSGCLGRVARSLQWFHNLYRPHHAANKGPARFHNGVVAEVAYNTYMEVSCEISTRDQDKKLQVKVRKMTLPVPVFRPNMFVRATITGWDRKAGQYTLEYKDGPYLADEDPDGAVHFEIPKKPGCSHKFMLRNVSPTFVSVDLFDNYGSHWPIFVVLISLIQLGYFVYYVVVVEGIDTLSAYTPVGGPQSMWLQLVSAFPDCESYRAELYRMLTYQFVHNGANHVIFNIVLQIIFGLPLNMVHGSLKFGLIYELGVVNGAFTWGIMDGAYNAVVGCSGGVYCIFGMHLAEIVTNWSLEKRGVFNRWTRLFVMVFLLGADTYMAHESPSDSTSYSAHAGGLAYGFLCGIIFLDSLETTCWHRWVGLPLSVLLAIALPLGGINYFYNNTFPPAAVNAMYVSDYTKEPCCWPLMHCSGETSPYDLDPASYQSTFYCPDGTSIFSKDTKTELFTCAEFQAAATANGF